MNTRQISGLLSGLLPLSALAQASPSPSTTGTHATVLPTLPVSSAPDSAELTRLLKDFLAGASRNDVAMHDRFWADDLIYTASSGKRIGKGDIMRDVREEAAAPPTPDETTTYTAEDIRIQQYDTTAIVAFRLVGTTMKGDKAEVTNYLNTGTFLKRDWGAHASSRADVGAPAGINSLWKCVAWQATKMPTETEPKK